jgi:hypothetical protein
MQQLLAAPDISISIVNYNTATLLEECLQSVLSARDGLGIEIFVVDNASKDNSVEMVRSKFPQVHLISNSENRFFSAAHNQALRKATGRYVLILNSDTRIMPGALRTMVQFMDARPEAGAASCLFLNEDGTVWQSCWRFHTVGSFLLNHRLARILFPNSKVRQRFAICEWDRLSGRQVDVISDAFAFVRSEVLRQIGSYDEQFLLYFTEDDLSLRLRRAGWKIFHIPQARIVHQHCGSTRKVAPSHIRRIFVSDATRYFLKHHGLFTGAFVGAVLWSEFVLRTLFYRRQAPG